MRRKIWLNAAPIKVSVTPGPRAPVCPRVGQLPACASILNLKQSKGAQQLRDIAEEAFAMVREYKGIRASTAQSWSVEFHRDMFGDEMVDLVATVKGGSISVN